MSSVCFLSLMLQSPSAAHPTLNPPPSLLSPPHHLANQKHKIESKGSQKPRSRIETEKPFLAFIKERKGHKERRMSEA